MTSKSKEPVTEVFSQPFGSPVYEQRVVSFSDSPGHLHIMDFTGDKFGISRRNALSLHQAIGDWLIATEGKDE
mgnify:CR=1 FL=1